MSIIHRIQGFAPPQPDNEDRIAMRPLTTACELILPNTEAEALAASWLPQDTTCQDCLGIPPKAQSGQPAETLDMFPATQDATRLT